MKRSIYYNYVEEKLSVLSVRVERRWKLNILDHHIHSENFYLNLLNNYFWWELENLNNNLQNVEAIDLIDKKNKYIIQVSATCTKTKVEDALSKESIKKYKNEGYSFKFISISKNAKILRWKKFVNPALIPFNPDSDIIDIDMILDNFINVTDINFQKKIYLLIKDELGNDLDMLKMESNITMVINILSEEDLSISSKDLRIETNPFEIKRKIDFNNLITSEDKINEYKIYHTRVTEKYQECDKIWKNKSLSILNKINKLYLDNFMQIKDSDELYNKIILELIEVVQKSSNFKEISYEELLLCVDILVVDAFIRCKIFKNPKNYNYVVTW